MNRLRDLLARDPLLVAVFAVLWGAALVPLWQPRWLPLLDLPNTLSAVALWHRYGDPSWNYQKYYTLNLLPLPYWGYLFPVHLLSYVFPIQIANKLFLSAYALALPVGAGLLAQRTGRSPWLALFAFPFVYNMNFSYGFVSFCAGMAMLLFALWALEGFLDAPTRGRGAALGLLTLALYFCHVLPWLYFGLAAGVLLSCHGWHPRRIAAAVALMLPSVAVGIYAFRAAAHGGTAVKEGALHYEGLRESTLVTLQQLPGSLLTTWPGDRAYQIMLLLGALWLALLLTSRTDPDDSAARAHGYVYRLELIAVLAALLPFCLPTHLYQPVDLWMVGGRFFSVAALLGALLVHGPIVGRRKLLLVPVAILAFVYPLLLGQQWSEFDRRAGSARRLLPRIRRGSSTLTLVYGDGRDPSVAEQQLPYVMFHAYPQLQAGGYDPWSLGTGFPMVKKPDAALPAPPWRHPEQFDKATMADAYDYILTYKEINDYSIFGPNDSVAYPLLGTDGDWRLYEVRGARKAE